jgi:hypothetical protein
MNHTTKTNAPKGNGHSAGHAAPAKTFTKRTADFIALCAMLVVTDARLFTLAWAVGLVGLLAAIGTFK